MLNWDPKSRLQNEVFLKLQNCWFLKWLTLPEKRSHLFLPVQDVWSQVETLLVLESTAGEDVICPSLFLQVTTFNEVGWLGFPCKVTFILLNRGPAFTTLRGMHSLKTLYISPIATLQRCIKVWRHRYRMKVKGRNRCL